MIRIRRIGIGSCVFTALLTLMSGYVACGADASRACDDWAFKIVSVQGLVEARKTGQTQWIAVQLDDTYCSGDMIRVQENSRATVVLPNQAVLRVDQNTALNFAHFEEEKSFLLELVRGAVYFFSRLPRTLKVLTPFVNGSVEGTEFYVRVDQAQTYLSVFEGRLLAENKAGKLLMAAGQSGVAESDRPPMLKTVVHPRDAVQWALYYPAVIDWSDFSTSGKTISNLNITLRESIGYFQAGDLTKAFSSLKIPDENIRDPRFFSYRASLLLFVGQVDRAAADIKNALRLDPVNSDAHTLQAIIAVVRNDKQQALEFARKAVELDPQSASAHVALSYVQQSRFDLTNALQSLQTAVAADPQDALAWTRLAEIQQSLGYLDKAGEAARRAVDLNPQLGRTQTVLGFALLTQIRIKDALDAFQKAIVLDSADPLARLGLGLALIRKGHLAAGRQEIEIAAGLDPNNSLIRSYLGKAYFEEKRDKLTGAQFEIAKQLDPLDPTPWFYDAIRKQTINRPVEALQDLQKSIQLNDNRAVYRSRLLLDEDLAARSASLGRIYRDLNFQQLALVEGWKSVNTDPANYSAHRFLADTYSVLPRHEIARVSELLQSQLLQPLNITPVQPQLAESNLFILEGAGPSDVSFSEFNPLFNRNRLALQANGVAGGNDTLGEDVVVSGVWDRSSWSVGQFHFETDGFRENNDQNRDVYNAFAQVSLSPRTSVQAEYRYSDVKQGDLPLRFDPDEFLPTQRKPEKLRTFRLGLHHAFGPQSDIITSLVYGKSEADLEIPPFLDISIDDEGYQAEVQHLFRCELFNLTSGVGYFDADRKEKISFIFSPTDKNKPEIQHTNAYVYAQLKYPEKVTWTLGGSADFLNGAAVNSDQFNPKAGLTWQPFSGTTLRAAAFRTLKRTLLSSQTVEPTQVDGFNQFFDDLEGTDAWRYGVGIDQKLSATISTGAEYSRRDLKVPFDDLTAGGRTREADWKEDLARIYLYWTPANWLALSAEYQFEKFKRDLENTGSDNLHEVKTHRVPLGISLFHASGFGGQFKVTYIDQKGEFGNTQGVDSGEDQFAVVDAFIRYRLPKRLGIVSIEARNLFDEDFHFQDTDPANPSVYPERLFLARLTLAF